METTLYEVSLNEGRYFKVFCANKHQKERFLKTAQNLTTSQWKVLENGIHDIKQWENIINIEK